MNQLNRKLRSSPAAALVAAWRSHQCLFIRRRRELLMMAWHASVGPHSGLWMLCCMGSVAERVRERARLNLLIMLITLLSRNHK
jgi:hypothetical protein